MKTEFDFFIERLGREYEYSGSNQITLFQMLRIAREAKEAFKKQTQDQPKNED